MYKVSYCETKFHNLDEMSNTVKDVKKIETLHGKVEDFHYWSSGMKEICFRIDDVNHNFFVDEVLKKSRKSIEVGDEIEILYMMDRYNVNHTVRVINKTKKLDFISVKNSVILSWKQGKPMTI